MGETLEKNRFPMPQPFLCSAQVRPKIWQVSTTNIFEFGALEQIPNAFLRIEFRRIARETFQMNALASSLTQELFHDLALMNGRSIPDDEQLACDLAREHL